MNLARKLRPKIFEEIVGQDLVKSMLKNSLFLDKIFPAYLFAGQRGCGKTTTARIFAKSLNCQVLCKFRSEPKNTDFPCLVCQSCLSMENLSHPDFLELDAASNNGVENIRQIIETTFYQPTLSVRRVFLIDEAHMLSKAAFNALLKILEEPPKTVTFILATTELEKIPLTIRSRSFLGLFPSLAPQTLFDYLISVCTVENIEYEPAAIWFLVRQSQGCPRDALNLLEQVFFCQTKITLSTTEQVFSYCPVPSVILLCNHLFARDKKSILEFFVNRPQMYTAISLFETLQALWVTILNKKFGVSDSNMLVFYGFEEKITSLAKGVDELFLKRSMRLFWENQRTFSLVSQKDSFLQFLLLELCTQIELVPQVFVTEPKTPIKEEPVDSKIAVAGINLVPEAGKDLSNEILQNVGLKKLPDNWLSFLNSADIKKKRLLHVALSSATRISLLEKERQLLVELPRVNGFVESLVEESAALIKEALTQFFKNTDKIIIKQNSALNHTYDKKKAINPVTSSQLIDFSNKAEWPKVNLVVKYFPGSISVEYKKR